jgi:hypothetical protein
MPVVQKCYDLEDEEMNNLGATADISMYLTDVDIQGVYSAVSEFIKQEVFRRCARGRLLRNQWEPARYGITQSHKTKMMNEQVMTSFIEWAERVEKLTQENSLFMNNNMTNVINSRDILHDVFGMLRDDEHFLPRL